MAIFLQILGVIFLTIIVLVVVLLLMIRAKIRKFARTFEKSFEDLRNIPFSGGPSPRIHLIPMAANDWDDAEAIRELTEPLARRGFQGAGSYEIDGIPGMRIEALVKPEQGVTAVAYEHAALGHWLDLYTHYEDGTRITYANIHHGTGAQSAPGHDSRKFPGLSAEELYRKFMAERPDRPAKPVSAETFSAVFEKTYADEMDWRNSRGGPTEEEIRAVAALSGAEPDDEQIEMTRTILQNRALNDLDGTLRERFLEHSGLSPTEQENVRDRLVIIHDKLTPSMVEMMVEEWADEDDEEETPLFQPTGRGSIRREFAAYNATLPNAQRFAKIGDLTEPIEADVYCAPDR